MSDVSEADELFGFWTDPEPSRVINWWGKSFSGDGFEAVDPSGCRFLVNPIYTPDSHEKRWGVAWSDGPYLSLSSYLYKTAQEAMNMVDLYLAHES